MSNLPRGPILYYSHWTLEFEPPFSVGPPFSASECQTSNFPFPGDKAPERYCCFATVTQICSGTNKHQHNRPWPLQVIVGLQDCSGTGTHLADGQGSHRLGCVHNISYADHALEEEEGRGRVQSPPPPSSDGCQPFEYIIGCSGSWGAPDSFGTMTHLHSGAFSPGKTFLDKV